MPKYTKLTSNAKLALADIFVILEEKFIQEAKIDDVLLIKPDLEKDVTICVLAKNAEIMQTPYSAQLQAELAPYFQKLKEDFSVPVVYKFVTQAWDNEYYIKNSAAMIAENVMRKVQDPQYVPSKKKM